MQIAQRWVLARLRNQRFFSLAELNAAIGVLVVELNARQMRGFGSSRAELFAEIDRLKLGELPDQPYVFARWKRCRVAPDYHVEIDGHWYSTPYRLIRELVDVRIADKTVEVFHRGQRIASHARAPNRRGHTTIADHMPSAHRRYGKWTPGGLIVTSQIPVEHWHDIIGDPTLGDAILDRLVHNAHRLQLSGESMRKQNARNQTLDANSNP